MPKNFGSRILFHSITMDLWSFLVLAFWWNKFFGYLKLFYTCIYFKILAIFIISINIFQPSLNLILFLLLQNFSLETVTLTFSITLETSLKFNSLLNLPWITLTLFCYTLETFCKLSWNIHDTTSQLWNTSLTAPRIFFHWQNFFAHFSKFCLNT